MAGMFHLEDFQLLDWFYYRQSFLGDLFTAGDNYFNFARERGGNELNKLLPGVLLFCWEPSLLSQAVPGSPRQSQVGLNV